MTTPATPANNRTIARGYLWTLVGRVSVVPLSLGIESARGHLLRPSEVGLAVAGLWIMGLLGFLRDFGFGAALVQRTDLTERQIQGAVQAIATISVGLALAMAATAYPLALWYRSPGVTAVVLAMAPLLLAQGLSTPPRALLQRDMAFKAITLSELLGTTGQVASTIVLALLGAGVWAIVGGLYVLQVSRLVGLWLASPIKPRLDGDWSQVPSLMRFGGLVAAGTVLSYLITNADYLMLGRYWSDAELAQYFSGFRLGLYAAIAAGGVFYKVAYPAFVQLKDDPAALQARFFATVRQLSVLLFPIAFVLALAADDVVLALLGPQWMPAVPLVRIFAIVGTLRAVRTLCNVLLISHGRLGLNIRLLLLYAVVLIPAVALGAHRGTLAVALVWLAASPVYNVAVLLYVTRVFEFPWTSLARSLAAPIGLALLCTAAVAALRLALPELHPESPGAVAAAWFNTLAIGGVAAAVYIPGVVATEPAIRRRIRARLHR